MTNRLFARSSSLAARPLYTRSTLPGVWRYRLSPFSTGSGVSCKIPSTQPQTRFPNYLLQGVSDASALEKRKQMVESAFASILERLEIFYIDPQSNTLARQGFFEQLDRVVWKMDPEAKVYLSGGNIRNLFGYLYEEIRFAQNQTTDQILKGILTKEFAFRDETNGKIPKMAALGVGSDLDILIEFSPVFDAEKKRAVIDAVYEFMNRIGKGAKPSLIKRTLLPVPDVNEYDVQMQRATRQGGSPLDWLAFPITPRSGSQLRTPSHLPDLVDKILKGDLDFFPTTHAEDPEVTTARLFRSLIEVPYLQITEESYCEVERSIERLGQFSSNSEVLKKVSYVFERAMQNIRLPEASNRFVVPDEGDKIAKILHSAVKNIRLSERILPVLPEILPQKSIEGRSLDHDPGNLRKDGLLIPPEIFINEYTDNGILYHGTPNRDAMLPMLRGSLVVSTHQIDRRQGTAGYGRGFYTTLKREMAQGYSGLQGVIVSFHVNRSSQLRVIQLSRLGKVELANLSDTAKKKNKDLHEYLCQELDVDIIVAAQTDILLIQNANVFRIERTVEGNARLFFDVVCSIGSVELVQFALAQNIISQAEIEKGVFNASCGGYKEIIEILLKKGSISEEARGHAIVTASANGYREILEVLLGNGSITDEARGQATCHAAEKGFKEIVEILLDNGPITEEARGQAIVTASGNGYQEIVEILLHNGPITEDARGLATYHAAKNGLKKIVEILLDNGSITEEKRGRAIIESAREGHKEIVEILFNNGVISKEMHLNALDKAAEKGHKKIVEVLLWKREPISDEYMERAIFYIIKHNHIDLLEILLQKRTILEPLREKAIAQTLFYNRKDILEFLINNGPISDEMRRDLILYVARTGNTNILEILLKSKPISSQLRGDAIATASVQGDDKIVDILLKSGSISDESMERAIFNTILYNRRGFLEVLLQKRAISERLRGKAVAEAVRMGREDTLEVLINSGPISDAARGQAIVTASAIRYPTILEFLLSKFGLISDESMEEAILNTILYDHRGDHRGFLEALLQKKAISEPFRGKAVAEAARMGRKEMVAMLLDNGFISGQAREGAIRSSSKNGHQEIVEILLSKCEPIDEYMERAIFNTIRDDDKDFLKILLQKRAISDSLRENAIGEALRNGRKDILEVLINSGSISDEKRQDVIEGVAERGYTNILRILLKSKPISSQLRESAIAKAVKYEHDDIVLMLLNSGSISDEFRSHAFIEAYRTNRFTDILETILGNGSISEEALKHVLVGSAKSGGLGVVEIILNHGSISDQAREAAIRSSAENGHYEIVKILLNKGVISKKVYADAIALAAENGHKKVVKILLSKRGSISEEYMV